MATAERQEVKAVAKWVRMSPRKARLVAEHIRGRTVPEARTVLAFTPRAAARELEKVLRSAVANAEVMHRSMSAVHAANICMWLRRDLKYDPVKEEFPGDAAANRFRSRTQRAPWVI